MEQYVKPLRRHPTAQRHIKGQGMQHNQRLTNGGAEKGKKNKYQAGFQIHRLHKKATANYCIIISMFVVAAYVKRLLKVLHTCTYQATQCFLLMLVIASVFIAKVFFLRFIWLARTVTISHTTDPYFY